MTTKLEDFLTQNGLTGSKLSHFGRKGMHWGVRRSDKQLANATAESSDSPDAVRAHETLAKIRSGGTLSAVSDGDLSHLVNRINLEKRFADINPSAVDKGHEKLKKLLSAGDTMNAAIKFVNSPAGNLLASQMGLSKHGRHAKPPKVGKKKKP